MQERCASNSIRNVDKGLPSVLQEGIICPAASVPAMHVLGWAMLSAFPSASNAPESSSPVQIGNKSLLLRHKFVTIGGNAVPLTYRPDTQMNKSRRTTYGFTPLTRPKSQQTRSAFETSLKPVFRVKGFIF